MRRNRFHSRMFVLAESRTVPMTSITIPFSVEGTEKECLIQLRDLADRVVIPEIFRGTCAPGVHSVEFSPDKAPEGLDAGIYVLYVMIGNETETYPLQYMP